MSEQPLFTPDVARLAGISSRRLLALADQGYVWASIRPAEGSGSRRLWSVPDVLRVLVIRQLAGLPLKVIALRFYAELLTDAQLMQADSLTLHRPHLDNPIIVAPIFSPYEGTLATLACGEEYPLTLTINLRELRSWLSKRMAD